MTAARTASPSPAPRSAQPSAQDDGSAQPSAQDDGPAQPSAQDDGPALRCVHAPSSAQPSA